MVQLVTMTEPEYQQWMAKLIVDYAQEQVESGRWTAEAALQKSEDETTQQLPEGVQTKDHYLYTIVADDIAQKVGVLWFADELHPGGIRHAFVYDIEIDEPFRRRGYASQAFVELEKKARALGLKRISLHVFGNNAGARAMYEGLGYNVTHIQMEKSLA